MISVAMPLSDNCHIIEAKIIYFIKRIQEDSLCLAEATETMIHRQVVY